MEAEKDEPPQVVVVPALGGGAARAPKENPVRSLRRRFTVKRAQTPAATSGVRRGADDDGLAPGGSDHAPGDRGLVGAAEKLGHDELKEVVATFGTEEMMTLMWPSWTRRLGMRASPP